MNRKPQRKPAKSKPKSRYSYKRNRRPIPKALAVLTFLLAVAAYLFFVYDPLDILDPPPAVPPDGVMQVAVFDVGQSDCVLVQTSTHAMLIDAGNIGQDDLILGYLSAAGVTRLDYLVSTHPHADHIGAMAAVILAIDVDTLLMPDATNNTRVFERMLDAIEARDVSVTIPEPGQRFMLGDARITVLAPNSERYRDLNDTSLVLRVEYGATAFLLTGDAETLSETEQLNARRTLRADVLKVGHHGSSTSTDAAYLEAVSPRYAVISCGAGNTYGHPHGEVLARLSERQVAVLRTDLNGTVTFLTDGTTITVRTER